MDGSWLIDGSVTTERVKAALDLADALPGEAQGGYRTVGGFMMEQLGRIPSAGDRFADAAELHDAPPKIRERLTG